MIVYSLFQDFSPFCFVVMVCAVIRDVCPTIIPLSQVGWLDTMSFREMSEMIDWQEDSANYQLVIRPPKVKMKTTLHP